ncbi:hypothetical protein BDB00DRAFT_867566 [Zychaea mexicana]|uniref:uncharacterized protein n=1 Tax=Zychaea mexicana TaxID=64656 RepID=UPI0022FE5AB1|nr:uncharacterized protein BDB00DRAFT_867566 [Zychaea mexicana]KAI9498410.1 hypothetical protein BDB00DRAFT_867566 [Zychaea mexicana]
MLCEDGKQEMSIEDPELPYANEDDIGDIDKLEVDEIMEGNIEAEDLYRILNIETNAGKDSVYSLLSMAKRPNNSEKQQKAESSSNTSKKKNPGRPRSAAQASHMLRIPERTAQRYGARFRDEEAYLQSQFKKPERLHPILTNELSLFLQDPYDKKSSATLEPA